jgi:hypothetical protein
MGNNQDIISATGTLLVQRLNQQTDPGEKMGTAMSVAFNGIVTTAAMMMGRQFNPQQNVFPSMDHILLASLLINAGCSMSSDATVRVEFSPERMLEALEDFGKFTGRSGVNLLDPVLQKLVETTSKVDLSQFGSNSKFLQ